MTFRSKVSIVVKERADVCPFFASIKPAHSHTATQLTVLLNTKRLKVVQAYGCNFNARYRVMFTISLNFRVKKNRKHYACYLSTYTTNGTDVICKYKQRMHILKYFLFYCMQDTYSLTQRKLSSNKSCLLKKMH